jgi:hypothetical protein
MALQDSFEVKSGANVMSDSITEDQEHPLISLVLNNQTSDAIADM